jgi:hypothetical protein
MERGDDNMERGDDDMQRGGGEGCSMVGTDGGFGVGGHYSAAYGKLDSKKKLLPEELVKI